MELSSLVSRKWTICFTTSLLGVVLLLCYLRRVREFVAPWENLRAHPGKLAPVDDANPWKSTDNSMNLLLQGNKVTGIQSAEKCDIFDGEWVYDPQTYPLYASSDCPFLSDQVNCQNNGRPDSDYQRWGWRARNCRTPRFNATEMLERLRGKRVVFVGDSLNRNQWESLACMLYSRIPSSRAYVRVENGLHKVFHAKDYNCSVEFFWSPFLVQLEERRVKRGTLKKVLNLDTMSSSAGRWRGAEILVFNSGHWWMHTGKLKAWDLLQNEGKLIEDMDVEEAFDKAMQTWAKWIDEHVNPSQTAVFFRSISPEHKGKQWCYNQTQPHKHDSHFKQFSATPTDLIQKTIGDMKTPVTNLNVTGLSQYRVDAHTSVYTERRGKLLTAEQRRQPRFFADCSHWCLPGLPDTWNELLYQSLLLKHAEQCLQ